MIADDASRWRTTDNRQQTTDFFDWFHQHCKPQYIRLIIMLIGGHYFRVSCNAKYLAKKDFGQCLTLWEFPNGAFLHYPPMGEWQFSQAGHSNHFVRCPPNGGSKKVYSFMAFSSAYEKNSNKMAAMWKMFKGHQGMEHCDWVDVNVDDLLNALDSQNLFPSIPKIRIRTILSYLKY